MSTDAIERNAAAQNHYRQINEHLAHRHNHRASVVVEADPRAGEMLELFCECGQQMPCGGRFTVSRSTYERVRADPTTFILVSGHDIGAVEETIERGDGFLIARRSGRAAGSRPLVDLSTTPPRLVF
jgi:hypothetical protein